ncbi:hypothetical protein ACWDR0_21345 [Streptomyces sp. NPDC003691]
MPETTYGTGEGPDTGAGPSLPDGAAEAARAGAGTRESASLIAAAVERELRGQVLDEYLADYERRNGPVSESARRQARKVFGEALAEPARGPATGSVTRGPAPGR